MKQIGSALPYADGAEDEILAVLRRVEDRSTRSVELARSFSDWPTRYHFSYQRTNLLRPLRLGPGMRVLDVGAGSGVLTRHIAEQGAEVLALEGNPARAQAALERCAGLEGVEVLCGALQDLAEHERFDIVLLCGVLEYSGSEIGGATGAAAMLRRATSHLSDGGALVVAIENQIGLKYLLGAREDHLGVPWVGIEGYPGAPGVRTWSRRRLAASLSAAGLTDQHWMAPFPDYKMPSVVLDQRAYDEDDAPDLVDQLVLQPVVCLDHPPVRTADAAAAHRVFLEAGLGLDVANSFLVVAGGSPESLSRVVRDDALAWLYGGFRMPAWRRDRVLTVDRKVLTLDGPEERRDGWLSQHIEPSRPFETGRTLGQRALDAVRAHDLDELGAVLRCWADELVARAVEVSDEPRPVTPLLPADARVCLPDGWLDVSLTNFVDSDHGPVLIDDEWRTGSPVDLRVAQVRALWVLAREIVLSGLANPWDSATTVDDLLGILADLAGVDLDPPVVAQWREVETDLQCLVAGIRPDDVRGAWLNGGMSAVHVRPELRDAADLPRVREELAQLSGDVARLRGQRDWLTGQRNEFIGQRDHLEGVVASLEGELARLRTPKGFVGDALRRRPALRRMLSRARRTLRSD